jgi:hypothetical protein
VRKRTAASMLVVAAAVGAAVALREERPEPELLVDGEPAGELSGAPFPLRSRARAATGVRGAARVAPPGWEPEILTTLARWEPARPRRGVTRLLAYVWAAPMTLGGLVAGAASGVRPRVRDGVLLFAGARGLPAAFFARRGYSAFALGHVIVARGTPGEALLVHELLHVRQAERFGPLMAPLYLALHALYGYARHPMERAARRAQRRALSVGSRP